MAPELLPSSKTPIMGDLLDSWAIGVIAYMLLIGYPPFEGDDEEETFVCQSLLFVAIFLFAGEGSEKIEEGGRGR